MNEKTFTFMLRTGEKYSMTTKNRLQDTSMKHTRVVAFRKTPLFASGGLLGTTRPIHFRGPHDPRVSISYRLNQGQLIEQLPPLLPPPDVTMGRIRQVHSIENTVEAKEETRRTSHAKLL